MLIHKMWIISFFFNPFINNWLDPGFKKKKIKKIAFFKTPPPSQTYHKLLKKNIKKKLLKIYFKKMTKYYSKQLKDTRKLLRMCKVLYQR